MDKEVFQINENGYIIGKHVTTFDSEGNSVEELKENTITIQPPAGLFLPKWNGTKWVESTPQEEIDELWKQSRALLTEIEQVKISQATQFETILELLGGM